MATNRSPNVIPNASVVWCSNNWRKLNFTTTGLQLLFYFPGIDRRVFFETGRYLIYIQTAWSAEVLQVDRQVRQR